MPFIPTSAKTLPSELPPTTLEPILIDDTPAPFPEQVDEDGEA